MFEPGFSVGFVERSSAQIYNLSFALPRANKVSSRKLGGTSEENQTGTVEAAFFHRLYHRGFSAGFRQRSCSHFLIPQPQIPSRELAFFEQRLQLRPQQRRRTRNDNPVGIPFERRHQSRGPRNIR